jgi:hypothetical protein
LLIHHRVGGQFDAAAWTETAALLIAAPALLFPTPLRLVAVGGLCAVWLLLARLRRPVFEPTPLDPAIAALLMLVLVNAWTTYDVADSSGKLAGTVFGICVYFALVRHIGSTVPVATAVVLYGALGAGVVLVLLLGTAWAGKWGALADAVRLLPGAIRGIPGAEGGFHPNAAAGTLVLFVPVHAALAAIAFRDRWRPGGRAIACAILAASVTTLALTQSRSAWFATCVAAAAWAMVASRRARTAVAVCVVAAAAAAPAVGLRDAWRAVGQVVSPVAGGDMAGRLEVQQRALLAIADQPLTGIGMNGFRRAAPELYTLFSMPSTSDVAHAHQQFLQVALDLGVPALGAYFGIWIGAALMLRHCYRLAAASGRHAAVAGLGAALAAHFLFGLFDAVPLGSKAGVMFWAALALCSGMYRDALRAEGGEHA